MEHRDNRSSRPTAVYLVLAESKSVDRREDQLFGDVKVSRNRPI